MVKGKLVNIPIPGVCVAVTQVNLVTLAGAARKVFFFLQEKGPPWKQVNWRIGRPTRMVPTSGYLLVRDDP